MLNRGFRPARPCLHVCRFDKQKASLSTFAHLYRVRQLPNVGAWRAALNRRIAVQLLQDHRRGFSHTYRFAKSSLPSPAQISGILPWFKHLCDLDWRIFSGTAQARTYSASYRAHHTALFSKLAGPLSQLCALQEPRRRRPQADSDLAVLLSGGFRHHYRQRQLNYLRAYLPRSPLTSRGIRQVSSVPLLSHMTESDAAAKSRRRTTLVLRMIGAGITVYLALRFLQEQSEVAATTINDTTYVPLKLTKIEAISPSTSIFTLHSTDDIGPCSPIASISIKDPASNIQRPYTLLSVDKNVLKILVKKYDDGELSRYIHAQKVDSEVFVRRAAPAYEVPAELPKSYLFIVGGTGIATAYQLSKHLSTMSAKDIPKVSILYASSSPEEVYLRQEFDSLKEIMGDKLHIEYFIDTERSFITKESIAKVSPEDTTALVCGTDGFVAYVAGPKPEVGQGQIGGLLKEAGATDVWKL